MADNIPARLAPAAHGGHVGFLEQFSTLVDYFVDGLIMPFFKYWSRHCAASRR
jgi:predicted alpha/beta-fold hydrolase